MTTMTIKEMEIEIERTKWRKTPTQRAIMAYRYWARRKEAGDKLSQGEVAKIFGVGRAQISIVKKLMALGKEVEVEALLNGEKMELENGTRTSNIRAVLKNTKLGSKEVELKRERSLMEKILDRIYSLFKNTKKDKKMAKDEKDFVKRWKKHYDRE